MLSVIPALLALAVGQVDRPSAATWKAGTARVAITPREPTWMAGFSSRTKPSEGKVNDLWAKALALEDARGEQAVLVTLDVCGIGADVSNAVRDAIEARSGLSRARVVLACSHTHCGPVVGKNLIAMYRLDDAQRLRVEDYTRALIALMDELVAEALDALEPAELSYGNGRADFAVNRRENKEAEVPALREALALKGPVDHDVPVLRVSDGDGGLKAVVFGYACHCTTLDFNRFCGDYAGFAQVEIERAHPGTQAMFVAGCGADQDPIPRRSLDLAQQYGTSLGEAVDHALGGHLRPISGDLAASYEEIPLKYAAVPTKTDVEEQAKSNDVFIAARAQSLLITIEAKGGLPTDYPYPVQVWRLGDLTWVLLGGEVVVDYSLRLKANLGSARTWISGYCNDVMAYIPSKRVLKEGGYEGGKAMIYYGLPSPWADSVEEDIVTAVARGSRAVKPAP